MQKIIKDDLRYLLFSEVYQRIETPKGKRKALLLLEIAIGCFAKYGFKATTLEMIAREAGVTRPMIRHYFDSLSEIEEYALKYIRYIFQKFTVEAIAKENSPSLMLSAYVKACIDWTEQFKSHAVVWVSFLHRGSYNKKSRALNTAAVSVGTQRIAALLTDGKAAGEFRFNDTRKTARMIQLIITGSVISALSEDYEIRQFTDDVTSSCLALVGTGNL